MKIVVNRLKNRQKGFTLIELLAVIVILAIIALIATPIVLNIINEARESSDLRSAEFYLHSLEHTIADAILHNGGIKDGTYYIMPDGNLCMVELTEQDECPKTGDKSNLLEVQVNGNKPKDGSIEIKDGDIENISINLNDKTIVKNTNGELVFIENQSPCKLISGNANAIGSKYECEVKPGTKYNFFVISQESDGTTNLIMERNICEEGTVATAENKCTVEWVSKTDYNDDTNYGEYGNHNKGPVTAMNYLYNATKDWINIPNMIMNYEDENINSVTQEKGMTGYGTIITTNNITKITKKDGTVVTVLTNQEGYTNLKARLPRYNEVTGTDKCTTSYGRCPLYLVNYLSSSEYVTVEGLQNISGIYGYWTLSSLADYSAHAWFVYFNSIMTGSSVYFDSDFGVRPVINLKL